MIRRLAQRTMIAGHRRSGSGIVVLWCLAIFTWTVALAADAAPAGSSNSCIACHQLQHDKRLRQPAVGLPNDVHFTKGFACQDCHGGDPTGGMAESDPSLAHDSAKGFVGAPTPAQIPEFCARCHSDVERMKQYDPKMRVDQLQEYRSSQHGKKLAQGDAKVATCISCHGVHGILPVADTRSPVYKTNVAATCAHCHADTGYMGPYGIPTNQFKLYRTSVHGSKLLDKGDLGAPTCNNCHGNHGATPPGLTSIAATCGECHANNREFFNQSPHKEAFASLGVGECTACHNHHDIAKPADSLLGVGPGSLCITCHSEGEPGYRAAALMSAKLDSLKTTLHTAHDMLEHASRGGVDVALGKFDLHSADDALIKARTAVHYFDTAKFDEATQAGMVAAGNVVMLGREALADLRLRRIGLAFTLPLILLLALLLYQKIRRIEGR